MLAETWLHRVAAGKGRRVFFNEAENEKLNVSTPCILVGGKKDPREST